MRLGAREASVALVIPCLNEEATIAAVVRACLAQGVDEVIVVDGGSPDATVAQAGGAGARVIVELGRGYGRAMAAGVAAVRPGAEIIAFMDGGGSDAPEFLAAVVGPVARDEADFVMGSRLRGTREMGSLRPQQVVAGHVAGFMLRAFYGAHFTDMSPFRAMRRDRLLALGMAETTYGWNLEMQMRVAAAGLRVLEVPVDHFRRKGGVSKVSGNWRAGIKAGLVIAATFARLAVKLRGKARPKA